MQLYVLAKRGSPSDCKEEGNLRDQKIAFWGRQLSSPTAGLPRPFRMILPIPEQDPGRARRMSLKTLGPYPLLPRTSKISRGHRHTLGIIFHDAS